MQSTHDPSRSHLGRSFFGHCLPGFLLVGLICSCQDGGDGTGSASTSGQGDSETVSETRGVSSLTTGQGDDGSGAAFAAGPGETTAEGAVPGGMVPGGMVPGGTAGQTQDGKGAGKGQRRRRPQDGGRNNGARKVPGGSASGARTTQVPGRTGLPGSTVNSPASSGTDTTAGGAQNPINQTTPIAGGDKDADARLSIEFGAEKHDFGSTRQGDILEHTFGLKSTGANPVRIRQVSPTCGCTVGKVLVDDGTGNFQVYKMGDEIPSNRDVRIEATLDTTSKTNKTQVRINVYTNDPIGLTQLALTSNIEPFIKATPPFVNLGDIKEGEQREQVIDIRTSRGEPVMLTDDNSNPIKLPAGMSVELIPVNPHDDGRSSHWQAKITVGEGANEGPIGYQLRLNSDYAMPEEKNAVAQGPGPVIVGGEKFYKVSASVNGRVLGALSFTPQFLSMGLVRPGQRAKRNVKVISHDPSFDLSQAKVELRPEVGQELAWSDKFSTSLRPAIGLNNAIDVQLVLEGLPEGSDGSFRGVMVILTGHPTKPELAVRFSGVCRAGVGAVVPDRR